MPRVGMRIARWSLALAALSCAATTAQRAAADGPSGTWRPRSAPPSAIRALSAPKLTSSGLMSLDSGPKPDSDEAALETAPAGGDPFENDAAPKTSEPSSDEPLPLGFTRDSDPAAREPVPSPVPEARSWPGGDEGVGPWPMCPECGEYHPPGDGCVQSGPESFPWLRHSGNSPRSLGYGDPLIGTSWLNRPYSVSGFVGVMGSEEWLSDRVAADSDLFGGFRLGWDIDHYWGLEARMGFFSPDIYNLDRRRDGRSGDLRLGDLSLLYYFWGDTAWRPYAIAGLGVVQLDFFDDLGDERSIGLLGIPIGGGLKYLWTSHFALRIELLDNIAVGDSGVAGLHNVSFTLGIEYRYGGARPSYYPWHPGRQMW